MKNQAEPLLIETSEVEAGATFVANAPERSDLRVRSSAAFVTLGCAAAIAIALVGAAYAIDGRSADPLRGDRLGMAGAFGTVTIEETNATAGISNLVLFPSEPSRP